MTQFALLLTALVSYTTISSCKSARSDPSSDLSATPSNNLDALGRGLASGYDTRTRTKLAPCIDVNKFVYSGANTASFSFMRDAGYEQIIEEAGAGLYGKASLFGLVSAKVQGDMATSLATTDSQASFIYKFDIRGKNAIIDAPHFNAKGSTAVATKDDLSFRTQCGDQYIERVSLGAQLFIGVKYTFTSKEAMEKLRLKISAELFWGLIKISKTWSTEMKALLKDLIVSVEAYQIGGDERQLAALVNEVNNVPCKGDDAERCAAAADRLLLYGSREFPTQLNNQVFTNDAYKGLATLSAIPKNYSAEEIYNPATKSYNHVTLSPEQKTADDITTLLSSIERAKLEIKMALARAKALQNFELTKEEAIANRLAIQEIEGVNQVAARVSETDCKLPLLEIEPILRCAFAAGDLENKKNHAVQSLVLPDR